MITNTFQSTIFLTVFTPLMFFVTYYASAEESKFIQPITLQYCEEDRVRYCKDKKAFSEISSCLIEHDKEVTTECKQELERFIQMRRQTMSSAGGALSSFGGLNAIGPPIPLISYDGRYSTGANSTSFTENKLNISSPVFKSEKDTVSLSLIGSNIHLGNSLMLDSGKLVPTDLYRFELGAQYFNQLPDKKNWGIRGSIGSAGDKPFANLNDVTYSLSANYGFPGSGNGYWKVSVFFSNNNPIRNYVPIPGFAYLYKTESFTGVFGFPVMSLQWTPVFPWSFTLGIFGPTIQSEVGYGSIDRFQVFSGFYWTRQSYIPNQRDNAKDRLTIEEKKAAVGFRTPIWESILAEFQLGQAFDRSVYIGNGLLNKEGGSASIPSDWYMSTNIKLKF